MSYSYCIGYARVSTGKQELLALEQQKKRLEDSGIDELLYDVESGSSFDRSGFRALVDRVELGLVSRVVVTRMDRLGRGVIGVKKFIDLCRKYKVEVVALDEAIDTGSASGRFHLNMLLSFAEMELDQIRERVKHGHAYRKKKKLPYKAVFGYVKCEDGLEFDTEPFLCLLESGDELSKMELAREIVFTFLGKMSMLGTVKYMVEKYGGVVGYASTPGLSKWLSHPVLRGYLVYGRGKAGGSYSDRDNWEVVDRLYPALISDGEWEKIRNYLESVEKNRNFYRVKDKRVQPFGNLLKCDRCGVTGLSIGAGYSKNKRGLGYQCANYKKRLCDNKKWVNIKKVEVAVDEMLRKRAKQIAREIEVGKPESKAEAKLKSEIRELQKIANPSVLIEETIAKMEQELMSLRLKRMDNYEEQVETRELLVKCFKKKKFYEFLKAEMSPIELKAFYLRLVKKVGFDNGNVTEVELVV